MAEQITQTIGAIPTAGHRGVDAQTIFVTKQEAFQDQLTDFTVAELNTYATQANAVATEVSANATQVELNKWVAQAHRLTAESIAYEPDDVEVKYYTSNGDGTFTATAQTGIYSALHHDNKASASDTSASSSAVNAELDKWIAEAEKLTAISYATEAENVEVKIYTSNGDGTFTATPQNGIYSALHHEIKAGIYSGSVDGDKILHIIGSGLPNESYVKADIDNLRVTNKSSLLRGTTSLSNTVITAGIASSLYTGNGTTTDVVTGVDMKSNDASIDLLTLWSAGTYNTGDEAYIVDTSLRKIRVVCLQDGVTSDPNSLLTFTDATFSDWQIDSKTNGGMVWRKERGGSGIHGIVDSLRYTYISTDTTGTETSETTFSFNVDGFSTVSWNTNLATFVAWSYQTTHMISGLTSHNQPYITEYNPVTGYSQIKYKGSGLAGNSIPHYQGRTPAIKYIKDLSAVTNWATSGTILGDNNYLYLNATNALASSTFQSDDATNIVVSTSDTNTNGNLYIAYTFANSYIDAEGDLIGNFEIGTYGGTGVAGIKVPLKDKPAYVMIKNLTSTGNWTIIDNIRLDNYLYANSPQAEVAFNHIDIVEDGIIIQATSDAQVNTAGAQYLYIAFYDNDNGSGKSNYDAPSDTTNLQITDGVVSISEGVDTTGAVNSILNLGTTTLIPDNGWEI